MESYSPGSNLVVVNTNALKIKQNNSSKIVRSKRGNLRALALDRKIWKNTCKTGLNTAETARIQDLAEKQKKQREKDYNRQHLRSLMNLCALNVSVSTAPKLD